MAEEIKPEEKKTEGTNVVGALLKGALGLVFLALGIWAVIALRSDLFVLIKGCIGPFLILAGIITLAIAKD
jgi:hypothetical protein